VDVSKGYDLTECYLRVLKSHALGYLKTIAKPTPFPLIYNTKKPLLQKSLEIFQLLKLLRGGTSLGTLVANRILALNSLQLETPHCPFTIKQLLANSLI
jgi:hypothetical protein